jgi:NAD(P)-dependent dehydrogenase (short-subunit alcohol dehydrogenase family)
MATKSTTKTAVVTGATSGLGEAAAVALAKAGYRVLAVGRDAERGAAVVARAKAAGGEAEFLSADLFSLDDVRRLAREIRSRAPSLDLLVNNAGGTFGSTQLTRDGLERTFALNVAAPFVLTEELVGPLSAAKGRIVNLVTGVQKSVRTTLDQLTGAKAGAGVQSYVRNKLALLAITQEQQRRYGGRGITAVALHPGVIPDTRFGQDMPAFLRKVMGFIARLFRFASTLDEAAARYLAVGTGPVEGAGFYYAGTLRAAPLQAQDTKFTGELWAHVAQVTSRGALPAASAVPALA